MRSLRKFPPFLTLAVSGLALVLNLHRGHSATIYVNDDAPGASTGQNWTDAHIFLRAARSVAKEGDQIWVTEGVYDAVGIESQTFQLVNGVEIYGGFEGLPGTEGDFGLRDFEKFLTVLSGDLAGDDMTDGNGVVTDPDNIVGRNSEQVVTGSGTDETAVLDGFTITAAQPAGGMTNVSGSRRVRNVAFIGNEGGGMSNTDNSSPILTNVTFSNNVTVGNGGGMYNYQNSSPTLTNVTFTENVAGRDGGGMRNELFSSPQLTEVIFHGNIANGEGGGMHNATVLDFGNSPTLTNGIFAGNTANDGGGMSSHGGYVRLLNVAFFGNSAISDGGGMYGRNGTLSALVNITFSSNSAFRGGGMANIFNSDPYIHNCIFWGNSAPTNPQIHNAQASESPHISNSLIQGGRPTHAFCRGLSRNRDNKRHPC